MLIGTYLILFILFIYLAQNLHVAFNIPTCSVHYVPCLLCRISIFNSAATVVFISNCYKNNEMHMRLNCPTITYFLSFFS